MTPELEKQIVEKYYEMFHEETRGPNIKSTLFSHIECGDGWFNIIMKLCENLYAMRPKVKQIKEKFGGLRFYASFTEDYSEQAWKLIKQAEIEASETCENCGQPGTLQIVKGWRGTVCDKCHEKWLQRDSFTDD
jgi:hypothetical protein